MLEALPGAFMRFLMPILAAASLFAQPAPRTPQVQEGPLRAHLAFLADDLLEGRGTGQRAAEPFQDVARCIAVDHPRNSRLLCRRFNEIHA